MSPTTWQEFYGPNAPEPMTADELQAVAAATPDAAWERLIGSQDDVTLGPLPTDTLTAGYSPTQARVPKGNPIGGEWIDTPGGVMRKAGGTPGRGGGQKDWDAVKASTAAEATRAAARRATDEAEVGLKVDKKGTLVMTHEEFQALPPDKKAAAAMIGYTGPLTYPEIQAGLRTGAPMSTDAQDYVRELTHGMAVGKVTLTEPAILHRAVRIKRGSPFDPTKMKPGDTFVDKAFTSSSTEFQPVETFRNVFGPQQKWVYLETYVPAGTTGFTGLDKFKEIVLDPGGVYKVVGTNPTTGAIQIEKVD